MPSLLVQDLAVARGDRVVAGPLSFAVAPGQVLHLRGRNGAGKTTLLEVLCGLRDPASGRLEGRPELTQTHWVGHKNALNPALSPSENLAYWCALNGEGGKAVDPALERVGLKAQRHRPCGTLSTGQRRRAALARLLAVPRPWWFLDEPLSGLDAAALDLLAGLLNGHLHGGGAAIVSSHQPLPAGLPGLQILELGR
jgi:heme exporter protein A